MDSTWQGPRRSESNTAANWSLSGRINEAKHAFILFEIMLAYTDLEILEEDERQVVVKTNFGRQFTDLFYTVV
tara:strand:+ start:785 stop:1003 length:219 start_codon:yes stop_codon:yes gene_type:complete